MFFLCNNKYIHFYFVFFIWTKLISRIWEFLERSFWISVWSFLSFVERFFSIMTVNSYFWIPFKTIPQYPCFGFIYSNPDSHLWGVSLKTEIDSPIDLEVVFLLESFDGFQVLFIQIDRGLSFWWFIHDFFSPVGNKWDIRDIPIYMRFNRPQWIAEVFCDLATTIIYKHLSVRCYFWVWMTYDKRGWRRLRFRKNERNLFRVFL